MLTPEALTVLTARYLRNSETPDDMFWRVANFVAAAEDKYGGDVEQVAARYFKLMSSLTFLPNSPTLMNAGKPKAQLAACFVLPVEDSLEGIFDALKSTALIHQSGGGTGFSFSRLRPTGDTVTTTGGGSSGPVSFVALFDKATEIVRQGAARRGANMAILRVDHPDIREFITAKIKPQALNNFNLSVGITDAFMQAVQQNGSFALVNPRTRRVVETVVAKDLFQMLVQRAWNNGEPGLFFLDTVNKANPTPNLGHFEAPNPCSEQPLLPYESCVLGSINLTLMLKQEGDSRSIDFEKLGETVDSAVEFLDNVIDVNSYPLEPVREATWKTRKIGLGIMGLADIFILLDIPYASWQAVALTGQVMKFITKRARHMSGLLAIRKGVFPAWYGSVYENSNQVVRNSTVTTIAPTGTISILANCSSGIEPLFGLSVSRRALDGQVLRSVNAVTLSYLEQRELLTDRVYREILETGSVQRSALPQSVKAVLATAHDVEPIWHVRQVAAAQQFTDNGVSKTVNLPYLATTEDVAAIFFEAWRTNCKGVTVYRDGSREQQVLSGGINTCSTC